jgi:hypothetical protein
VKVDISSLFGGEDNERIDCSSMQVDGTYRNVVHCGSLWFFERHHFEEINYSDM